jgi:hypothetical protein
MKEDDRSRAERIRRTIPISSIYPGVRDSGSSTCPICGARGKFYVRGGWAKCFRSTCDLTLFHNNKAVDVIGLYRYKENLYEKGSFYIAMDRLEGVDKQAEINTATSRRHQLLEECIEVYRSELLSKKGEAVRKYLASRGFLKESIELLGIGMASHSGVLGEYGIDRTLLEEEGLINYGKEVMSNRIIFPVRDSSGSLVHLTGRYIGPIPNDKDGDIYPKWKHTSCLTNPAIGNYLALEETLRGNRDNYVVLTEGYADALSLYQIGIPTVGSFGLNGLTKHIDKFRHLKEVICIYDIDTFPIDHPTYPLEYKSWRVVLPQLLDIQILLPDTKISLFFIQGEGKHLDKPYQVKDINEWLIATSPTKDEVLREIGSNKKDLVEYLITKMGPDIKQHELLIKLCISTGRGMSLLESYIPSNYSPLSYALTVMTV